MKLYEFIYTDNQNLQNSELMERIEELLRNECEIQGWAPGYAVHQRKEIEQLPGGGKNYAFEVTGQYLNLHAAEDEPALSLSTPSSPTPIAAKETEL